jgi:opacity protein-like surface antigen
LILQIDITLLRRQALAGPTILGRAFAFTAATAALAALAAFTAAAVVAAEKSAGVSDEGAVGGKAGANDGDVGFGCCLRPVSVRRGVKVGSGTDPDVIGNLLGSRRRIANVLGDDGVKADDRDDTNAGGR